MNLKAYLEHHCRVMLATFCLTHYSVQFYRQKLDSDTAMEIEIETEYLRAEISYGYLVECMWRQGKKKQILQVLCHELTHVLTEILWTSKSTQRNNEYVTEHFGRLLYKLYERRNK